MIEQISDDANRISNEHWERLHASWSKPPIVDAAFVIRIHIALSKFGDALGVELESMLDGIEPQLKATH